MSATVRVEHLALNSWGVEPQNALKKYELNTTLPESCYLYSGQSNENSNCLMKDNIKNVNWFCKISYI
jgi:hypothetical protein